MNKASVQKHMVFTRQKHWVQRASLHRELWASRSPVRASYCAYLETSWFLLHVNKPDLFCIHFLSGSALQASKGTPKIFFSAPKLPSLAICASSSCLLLLIQQGSTTQCSPESCSLLHYEPVNSGDVVGSPFPPKHWLQVFEDSNACFAILPHAGPA